MARASIRAEGYAKPSYTVGQPRSPGGQKCISSLTLTWPFWGSLVAQKGQIGNFNQIGLPLPFWGYRVAQVGQLLTYGPRHCPRRATIALLNQSCVPGGQPHCPERATEALLGQSCGPGGPER